MFGLTTTRRLRAELAAANANADRLREERDDARTERAAFRSAAQISARQFTEADATNRRLFGRNLELGNRLALLDGTSLEHVVALEKRIARLLRVVDRVAGAGLTAHRRADHLQQRLDQALGLDQPAILAKARRPQAAAVKKETAS